MGEGKEKLVRGFSAGGVVFKKDGRGFRWLIIKPAGTNRWQLPKGRIDKGEGSETAALREVEEEGGVEVKLVKKIGASQYFFTFQGQKIFKTVVYFLMEYLSDTKDGYDHEVDETLFLPFKEAYEKLTFKDDKEILKRAKEILDSGIQGSFV